jgi:hypothetical protein
MNCFNRFFAAAVLSAGFAAGAHAATPLSQLALGPVIGTTGVGLQVSAPLWPKYLNITSGFSTLGVGHNVSVDSMNYRGKLNLGGVPVYLSVFPFAGNFHLDGGLFINNNRFSATGNAAVDGSYTINGHVYSAAQIGTLNGSTHFNQVAPYAGIGWGDPFLGGKLTFTANAGVIFEGGSNIRLSAPNAAGIPGAEADIAAEQRQLNHDVSFLTVWPVVNLGLVYRF